MVDGLKQSILIISKNGLNIANRTIYELLHQAVAISFSLRHNSLSKHQFLEKEFYKVIIMDYNRNDKLIFHHGNCSF